MNKHTLITSSMWLSRLTIALLPLIVLPSVIYPFMFGKTLFLHTMSIVLLVIWSMLIMYEDQRKRVVQVLKQPITMLLLLYVISAAISSIFGVDPSRSFWGTQSRGTGLLTLIQLWLWFVLTRATHKTTDDHKKLTQIITVSGLAVSLLALARFKGIILFGVDTGLRISGTIANPIFFAGMLLLYIGIAGYGFFTHQNRQYKIFFAAAAAFQTVIMFLTQTRSAALGFIVGAVIAGVLVALGSKKKAVRRVTVLLMVLGIAFVALALIFQDSFKKDVPLVGRLLSVTSLQDSSIVSRVNAWKSGWESFTQKPIFGWGQESFIAAFDVNYNPDSLVLGFGETRFDRAHNIIIELLVTGGIVGLLTYGLLLLRFVYQLSAGGRWKKARNIVGIATLGAYLAHLFFSFDTSASLLLLLALCMLYESQEHTREEQVHKRLTSKQIGVACAALMIGAIGIYKYVYQPARESSALIETLVFAAEHSRLQAIPRLQGVLNMPSPYKTESRSEYVKNVIRAVESGVYGPGEVHTYIAKAEEVGLQNILDHKHDSYFTYLNGVLYYTALQLDPTYAQKSINYLKDAIAKSERQQYLFALAEVYGDIGDPQTAHEIYKQVRELSDKVGIGRWYYGLSLLTLDQNEQGAQEIVEALKLGHVPVEGAQKKLTAGLLREHQQPDAALYVYEELMLTEGNLYQAQSWAEFAIYLMEASHAHSAKVAAQTAAALDESFKAEADAFIEQLPVLEHDAYTDKIMSLHANFDVGVTL